MAYPEYLVLGMLFEQRKHIKKNCIEEDKNPHLTNQKVLRDLIVLPKMNFDAEDYIDI